MFEFITKKAPSVPDDFFERLDCLSIDFMSLVTLNSSPLQALN